MNIGLCIAWFIFGLIVGQLILIGIACVLYERDNKNGKESRVQERSNNYVNKDKQ